MRYRIKLINPLLGVPASFIDSGGCNGLKLVASATSPTLFTPIKKYENVWRHNRDGSLTRLHVNCNQQATLGLDTPPDGIYFTADNSTKYLFTPYSRVIIEVNNEEIQNQIN